MVKSTRQINNTGYKWYIGKKTVLYSIFTSWYYFYSTYQIQVSNANLVDRIHCGWLPLNSVSHVIPLVLSN